MSKRIEIDGKFYRKREGKLVQIPDEWVGKTLDGQTKSKRRSKRSAQENRHTPKRPFTKGRNEYFKERGLEIPWKSYKEPKFLRREEVFAQEEIEEFIGV